MSDAMRRLRKLARADAEAARRMYAMEPGDKFLTQGYGAPECTSDWPCNVPCPHCPWRERRLPDCTATEARIAAWAADLVVQRRGVVLQNESAGTSATGRRKGYQRPLKREGV